MLRARRERSYMDINELMLTPMRQRHLYEIHSWRYEGEYAFYNWPESPEPPVRPDAFAEGICLAALDADGRVAGHFHFGEDARIPTAENYDYVPGYADIGLGLRPDLCGRGYGSAFVQLGLDYARAQLYAQRFRLSVAAFNRRAIKTYQRCGFDIVAQVTNAYFKNQFFIMTLE